MRMLADALLAVALAAALLIVFFVDRSLLPASAQPAIALVQDEPVEEPPPPSRPLHLGVTPREPVYDDMGKLLATLGEGYRYTPFDMDDLLEAGKLDAYDVIFLTCGGYSKRWLSQRVGDDDRGSGGNYRPNIEAIRRARDNLRAFVGRGGTLYASDLRYSLVGQAFSEFVDRTKGKLGARQTLEAEIIEPGLRELLGPQLTLKFDLPGWYPAAFSGKTVTTMMRGRFETKQGGYDTAPLLVKFPFEDGVVIFTSFHNEKQNNEAETALLRYLVFSAVTAKVDAQIAKTMMRGGFVPTKQGLFSASAGQPSATQVYQCAKTTDLQFVLGFGNGGAQLRLSVAGPDGATVEKTGNSTIVIDVPAAAVGDWKYTVTALKLPNQNFPFTVTVGQK